jgi:hypothetical protein
MDDDDIRSQIILVTGTTMRAEKLDRPLAYSLKKAIEERIDLEDGWEVIVVSDYCYLNTPKLFSSPTISVGGPGVNALAALWAGDVPHTLSIDNLLIIQMDAALEDRRVSIWGVDHASTVDAIHLFMERGYLDRFLEAFCFEPGRPETSVA